MTPFELIKMRVLNAAQTSFAYLGLLAGHEHTCDDMTDPVLTGFVRRMLVEETPADAAPGSRRRSRAPISSRASPGSGTPPSATATTRSPPTARGRSSSASSTRSASGSTRGGSVERLTVVVAAWMVYLVSASKRFGERWTVEDPFAAEAARIADRVGRDSAGAGRRRSSPTIRSSIRALAGAAGIPLAGRAPSRRLAVARPGRLCSGGSRAKTTEGG